MNGKSTFQKFKTNLLKRWMEEDYPGGTPRLQPKLFFNDFFVFVLLPIGAVLIFKLLETSLSGESPSRRKTSDESLRKEVGQERRSQIIQFRHSTGLSREASFSKRAPGTLIRVRLRNVVETFSTSPVHAQIVDSGLGKEFLGGTLIGEANPDNNFGRISISFKFVRHPHRVDLAVPVSGRALSLDGTFGVAATKKEGVFARAAIRSTTAVPGPSEGESETKDFRALVARTVAAGLMQEFSAESQLANNRAQVFTIRPPTEFFVELTDYFPGQR